MSRFAAVSPQHGWARLNTWTVQCSTPSSITLTLSSEDAINGRCGHWPVSGCAHSVVLWLNVTFTEKGALKYTLVVRNKLETCVPIQLLLHTYYNYDTSRSKITGLDAYEVEDTQPGFPGRKFYTQEGAIKIDKEVDRIFHPSNDEKEMLFASMDGKQVKVSAAVIQGEKVTTLSPSAVVWNPWIKKAKGMGDFEDEGYKNMVCVEPGIINGQYALGGGEMLLIEQIISVGEGGEGVKDFAATAKKVAEDTSL